MGFSKAADKDAYLALLDADGRVRWLHRGGFSDEAMTALKTVLAGEAAPPDAR